MEGSDRIAKGKEFQSLGPIIEKNPYPQAKLMCPLGECDLSTNSLNRSARRQNALGQLLMPIL